MNRRNNHSNAHQLHAIWNSLGVVSYEDQIIVPDFLLQSLCCFLYCCIGHCGQDCSHMAKEWLAKNWPPRSCHSTGGSPVSWIPWATRSGSSSLHNTKDLLKIIIMEKKESPDQGMQLLPWLHWDWRQFKIKKIINSLQLPGTWYDVGSLIAKHDYHKISL